MIELWVRCDQFCPWGKVATPGVATFVGSTFCCGKVTFSLVGLSADLEKTRSSCFVNFWLHEYSMNFQSFRDMISLMHSNTEKQNKRMWKLNHSRSSTHHTSLPLKVLLSRVLRRNLDLFLDRIHIANLTPDTKCRHTSSKLKST